MYAVTNKQPETTERKQPKGNKQTNKQTNKQNQPLRTVSGKFYVGMTAEQAKKAKIYDTFTGRDFTDIDTNHNGILEAKEICDERDRECKRENYFKKGMAVVGCIGTGLFGCATIASFGMAAAPTVACAGVTASSISDVKEAQRQQEITDNYRKQFGL